MFEGFSTILSRKDGTQFTIQVSPVHVPIKGTDEKGWESNGVYELYFDTHPTQKDWDAYIHSDADKAGSITFRKDDPNEWIYIGDALTVEESEQVARAIQGGLKAEENEEAITEVIPFYDELTGTSYQIENAGGTFTVSRNGQRIAILFLLLTGWQQLPVDGEPPMDEELKDRIIIIIDAYYD